MQSVRRARVTALCLLRREKYGYVTYKQLKRGKISLVALREMRSVLLGVTWVRDEGDVLV